ncbi:MAG TPA: hypothetical protein VL354_04120 [Spirochaetia bacterium]|nr:hypothetical protein [Spirochaetia bacterium]
MQFVAFEKGIQVNGTTVNAVIDGLGSLAEEIFSLKVLARDWLAKAGIGTMAGRDYRLDPEGWYSQEAWLRVFEAIAKEIGEAPLKQIGMKIPENAIFPPWVQDIDSAIRAIDIAYHMNHRKSGKVLFDPATGTMEEGIGHYGYERVSAANQITSECNNPYPCSFDFGIIAAMAAKFQKNARVVHDDTKPCRKKGADSCTYIITW